MGALSLLLELVFQVLQTVQATAGLPKRGEVTQPFAADGNGAIQAFQYLQVDQKFASLLLGEVFLSVVG
ncbi:hypothetical protein [Pseudomonas aeruginosa]|uniref:hypothetical protein n=1 Tax=Pseudomonas aeruginosa TaxID=287 RepID=UPI0035BFC1CA